MVSFEPPGADGTSRPLTHTRSSTCRIPTNRIGKILCVSVGVPTAARCGSEMLQARAINFRRPLPRRLRRRTLTNFAIGAEFFRCRGDAPAVKTSILSASSSAPSSHITMLMLHADVMLQAAVLLPAASSMDQRHRAGRRDVRGCPGSATALQIALAEQRQYSAATCSPWSYSRCALDVELILVHAC